MPHIGVTFPGKDEAGVQQNNPFAEQLEYFRRKLNLPTDRYDDILKGAHDRAFVVAGASQADLLQDLNTAISRGILEGRGIGQFRKDFKDLVLKNGWTGWTGEGTAAGHAWRTRVIYTTNMSTSYAAGRWKQLHDPALLALRPYFMYIHSDSVMHPRPLHQAWNGLVLHYTDPFWQTHAPPNGWGCQCRMKAASAKEVANAKVAGLDTPPDGWQATNAKTGAPVGIDKGWDYAPGAAASRPLQQLIDDRLIKLDARIGSAMYDAMLPTIRAERDAGYAQFLSETLADPVKRNRIAVVGAIDSTTLAWLEENLALVPASAEIAIRDGLLIGRKALRHMAAGDAFTEEEWANLPSLLERPEQILYDTRTGKLLYVVATSDDKLGKLAVEFKFKLKREQGELNMIVSGFKVAARTIVDGIEGGLLRVILGTR